MFKLILLFLFLFSALPSQARSIKMGVTPGGISPNMNRQQRPSGSSQQIRRQKAMAEAKQQRRKAAVETVKSCLSTDDCPYTQECIALECRSVCYPESCPSDKRCTAFKSKPHVYQCVDCLTDRHCPDGLVCSQDTFTCEKPDPCKKAVCFQDAPYCVPVAYKTLPYTCVQCTEDSHCPPVAGLSRSCVKNSCLFNVAGNIPSERTESADKESAVAPTPPPAPAKTDEKPVVRTSGTDEPRVIESETEDYQAGDIVYDEDGTAYLVEEEEEDAE